MKALIINPYNYTVTERGEVSNRPRQPLDLAYISACIDELKIENEIIDAATLKIKNEKMLALIKESNPDFVVITTSPMDRWECPRTNIDDTFELIKAIKKEVPACKIIVYGSHGTTIPRWVLLKSENSIDILVKTEPELKIIEIAKYFLKQREDLEIPGIIYKDGQGYKEVEGDLLPDNLDELPMPNYKKLDMNLYSYNGDDLKNPFTIMLSSRGCPFKCTFCLRAMSPGYRTASPKKVVDEIEYLVKELGIKSIFFQDWEFLIKQDRAKEISEEIICRGIKIDFGINSRVKDVENDLVAILKKAGLKRINFGLESASNRILENVNKLITKEDIQTAIDICQKHDVYTGYYTLFNLPGENISSLRETAQFLAKNKLECRPGFVRYYPGTVLGKETNATWGGILKKSGKYKTKFNNRLAFIIFSLFFKYYNLKRHYLTKA